MSSGARVRRQRQAGGAHLAVDEAPQIAFGVGVAGQGRRVFGALAQRAQRRVAAQVAGLDHHAAFAGGQGKKRLDGGRDVAASGLHPHRAAAAEQRDGLRLLDEPARLGGNVLAVEPHQRERVGRIVDRRGDDARSRAR